MKYQVFVVPTHADCVDDAINTGILVENEAQAAQAARDEGYTVIAEDDGGCWDTYDAADATIMEKDCAAGQGLIYITVTPA